jgi:hypothetical protein
MVSGTTSGMVAGNVRRLESGRRFVVRVLAGFFCVLCIVGSASIHAANHPAQQALTIIIPRTNGGRDEMRRLHKLEEDLINAINRSRAGEYDGNEEGDATFTMYVYGPSADRLFEVVQPVLAKYRLPADSEVVKRYGKPGAREERVPLGTEWQHK